MSGNRNLWAWCVLFLFNSVYNLNIKNSNYLQFLEDVNNEMTYKVNNEVNEYVEFYNKTNNSSHIRTEYLNSISDNTTISIGVNSTFKESIISDNNLTSVVINMNNSLTSPIRITDNSTKHLKGNTASAVIAYFQNLVIFMEKKKFEKTDFMEHIQENLLKIYEAQFEDRNDIIQIENSNPRGGEYLFLVDSHQLGGWVPWNQNPNLVRK